MISVYGNNLFYSPCKLYKGDISNLKIRQLRLKEIAKVTCVQLVAQLDFKHR